MNEFEVEENMSFVTTKMFTLWGQKLIYKPVFQPKVKQ
jgi:hypothetical protein